MDINKEIEIKEPKFIKFIREKNIIAYSVIISTTMFISGFMINLPDDGVTVGYVVSLIIFSIIWGLTWTRFISYRREYLSWKKENA